VLARCWTQDAAGAHDSGLIDGIIVITGIVGKHRSSLSPGGGIVRTGLDAERLVSRSEMGGLGRHRRGRYR
jgi:hypothetical protein